MRNSLVLICLLASTLCTSLGATDAGTASAASRTQPQAMPRYFEANRGQWPAGQEFKAYGFGYGVTLAKDGIMLQIANPKNSRPQAKVRPGSLPDQAQKPTPPREVSLRFEGASPAARLTGVDELGAKGAWFQGPESNWHSSIPLFDRVRASQVYSGIDATFYGRDGQLEYDLDVTPGARADALILDLDGADKATIGKNGDLTIEVDGQQIVLHKPEAWQPNGQSRKPVEVGYSLLPGGMQSGQRIALDLKGYDASKALTIDPVLTFATYISSAATDYYFSDLALDGANNVYVLFENTYVNSMTVQKLTPNGALVYTATFASSDTNSVTLSAFALRVSAGGLAYIAASATLGYPTTSNAYQASSPNNGESSNGALSVLSADGSTLVYSTYLGGTANGAYGSDYAYSVAVDSSGNAYLAGQAGGDNFPTTTGAYQTTYSSGFPAGFVAKFNPSASGSASLVYSTLIGGTGSFVNGVAVDGTGNAYLSAYNSSCTYVSPTAGAFVYSGIQSASDCGYVTAVSPTGTALVYSAYLGPGEPQSIAVDGSHDTYITGGSIGADDFPTTSGAYQITYPYGFAVELNSTGGLVYSTFLGGPGAGVYPQNVALVPGCSSACAAYISGSTDATNFPVVNGLSGPPPGVFSGYFEGFMTVLNGTGSGVLTSGYLSGLNTGTQGYTIVPPHVAVDTSGNAWLAGTLSTSTPPDFPVTTSVAPGPTGAWVAEVSMSNAGNVIAVPNSVNFGTSIPVNVSSTVYNGTPTKIVLRNMGSAAVTLSSIVASPSYFSETDNCNGGIPASSYCTATLVFTPPNDAPVTGTLTITSNGLTPTLVIPLSGQGADAGFIVASPGTLNFGNQTINTTSAAQTVTLTNQGDEPISGVNASYFSPPAGFNAVMNCPASLPAGASCQAQVTFAPGITQVGPQAATLYQPYYGYYEVSVTGTGILPSGSGGTQGVTLSATTLNFGTEAVGTPSTSQSSYITNTGSLPLNFLTPTVTLTSAQGAAADFQVTGVGYGFNGSTLIPEGGYYQDGYYEYAYLNVIFTPSSAATETATVNIPIAGSATVITVNLIGQGMADTQVLEFQPGNAIFSDQVVGTTSTAWAFYLFNPGDSPFLVDRVVASGDFSISGTDCPGYTLPGAIAPGDVSNNGYCSIDVVFTPTQTGSRAGTLTVYDAASSTPQTIPLAGNGITANGILVVDPTILPFGSQAKGTSSAVQYVGLINAGNVNINVTGAATTGDYAITTNNCGTLPYALTPGESNCYLGVTFTPTVATSPDNGTLTITTSAGNQTVTLTGGGEADSLASGLSPTSINFGSFEVGTSTAYVPVYVRNTGTETLTFTTAATVSGDYSISDGCGTAGSGTLAPGQDCPIYVNFTPVGVGTHNSTLTVKSTAGTVTAALTGVGTSALPTFNFAPAAASFDQQAVNTISAPQTISFNYNGGNASFNLTGASVTAGSANFQLASGVNALNTCASPGVGVVTCQVNVVFSPSAAGYQTGTLTVTSNLGSYPIALSGYAPADTDSSYLSPGELSFGSQVPTTTSAFQVIYLVNSGSTALTVGSVGGTNFGVSSEFQISTSGGADYCSGQLLSGSNSPSGAGQCAVYVQFAPSAAGTRAGKISFPVTYADGTTGTITGNLTGIGLTQKNEAVLSPTVVTFPDTSVGTTSIDYQQYIYLTNSGNLPLNVGQITGTDAVVGTTTTGDFITTGNSTFDQCSGQTVAPASSCVVNVGFKPGSAGVKAGSLVFPVTYANTATPVTFTTTLTGNGVAASSSIVVSPSAIQFVPVTAGNGINSNNQSVTVTNTGNVPVTITSTSISNGFVLVSDGCTNVALAPGQPCTDSLYFNPSSGTVGTVTGTLTFHDTAPGNPQTVALSGVSVAPSNELEFSQTKVAFGNQQVSTASGQVIIYLINQADTAVTINSIALSGTNTGDFSESDGCAGYVLSANYTCPIYLTFTPGATGSRTATLKETDSGTGSGRTITLSGTGVNPGTTVALYPTSLAFSTQQPVGEGSTQQFFSVTATGVNPVTITGVTSTDPTEYPITQNGCTGTELTQGVSCNIAVSFAPTSTGSHTALIKIADNATGSPQELPLSGTGITQPTTSVSLAASPMSAAFGTLFTLTATVTGQNSQPLTNGKVTFYDGATVLGTVQVVSTTSGGGVIGTATLKTILIPLGSNSITAKYTGGDATSTSAAVAVSVTGKYPTKTVFTSSGSTGDYTFTATVDGAGPATPTGSVLFTDSTSNTSVGTAPINAGSLLWNFAAAPNANALTAPLVEALGDVNGDGIPDLVTGTAAGLYVQLGNGDGTFQTPLEISSAGVSAVAFGPLPGPSTIVFGDFNGDGMVDIAFLECANASSPCAVGVLLGNGNGTFQKERYYDENEYLSGIAVGDFDGDGIQDIAVANWVPGTIDLLIGNGDGTFQEPVSSQLAYTTSSIAAADLNGDGKLDIVATNWNAGSVAVLLGNGNGTFQSPVPYPLVFSAASDVILADLRGVGKLDIVTLNYSFGVNVLLGNGNGTFQTAATAFTSPSNDTEGGMAVADVNGDGKPDLVITDATLGQVYVCLGNGDGTFQSPTSYPAGAGPAGTPYGVAVADMNHDGRPDFVIANDNGNLSTILLNTVTQTATLTGAAVPGTGAQSVSGAYSGDGNFAGSTSNTLVFNGSLAPQTITFTAPASPVTYGVSPIALSASSTSGLPITFSVISGPGSVSGSTLTINGAGTVVVAANQAGNGSYAPAGQVTNSIVVNKAVLTVGPTPPQAGSNVFSVGYGDNMPYVSDLYVITGFVNGDTSAVVSGTPTVTPAWGAQPNVGTYALNIGAGTLSAANYTFTTVNGTIAVTPGVITIKPYGSTIKYGSAIPTLGYVATGLVYGQTAAGVLSAAPKITTTAPAHAEVGSYAVNANVTGITAANYTVVAGPSGTLTVEPALLLVKAKNAASTYGKALPGLSYTVSGFVYGQTAALLTATPIVSTTAANPAAAGSYPIAVNLNGATAPNYTVVAAEGTLTVEPARLNVIPVHAEAIYGSPLPEFTFNVTGLQYADTTATVYIGVPYLSTTAEQGSPAGSYSIASSVGSLQLISSNYVFNFDAGLLTIAKANLTVTANNQQIVEGQPIPPLTYSFNGFVPGDSATVVSGTAITSTTATASSAPGRYTISVAQGTLAAANYAFRFQTGVLTITP